ncbi:transporter of manganese MntH [Acetobacter tropicalis NBRC 101654]|uniref:Transporter of manganese MntH n=1 Tax=Acetobacter tropicalis NBRC 101654 TaxID=749388 RepID=F7VIL3_9PROT|nr:transporter of manganese MntH [Acetobacter tropicalis NBRC 101654]
MVSVGYMDPGNWATDLQGGAQSGYTLLSVIMLSNLMAILLQGLSARLDIATGRDLAQACRDHFPPAINIMLWLACELASIACDLAAVIGTAVALQLLFGIPLLAGAVISVLDTIIVLFLMNRGFRYLEAFIIGLLSIIAICFAVQVVAVAPPLAGIVKGFLPLPEIVTNSQMLYIASCCCSAKSSCRYNCPLPSFLWSCSSPTTKKWVSSSFPRNSPRSRGSWRLSFRFSTSNCFSTRFPRLNRPRGTLHRRTISSCSPRNIANAIPISTGIPGRIPVINASDFARVHALCCVPAWLRD